ncbi:hypothetical protein GGS23DRAFT_275796 [Durotheca rogersii]|uniref:uncharacterized protein n=1 Tax=Durotheca rogersii TaxID=419775 RepID=UPI00221F8A35|nr:uncharacterized protein GGS23DRAFT_275796 [Durotheca rogersii]KAI5866533.1 hypothetical protein GGS23DRAFT_275796 [Durotheca rogersii]
MAIIEVVFPQFKKDPGVIEAVLKALPVGIKAFKNAGVLRVAQGFLASENGRDVTSESREVLVLEWPTVSAFHDFVGSPAFANYTGLLKPFLDGPPQLNIFETNPASSLFTGGSTLEILLVSPKTAPSDEDLLALSKKVQSSLEKAGGADAVYGSSLNLPLKKIAVLRVFPSETELNSTQSATVRQEVTKSVDGLAEVTQLVSNDLKVLPL